MTNPSHLEESMGVILIVDDEPANLGLLDNLLTENGYQIQAAINGEPALQSIQFSLPDLILLDIRMPGMDGYEVCRRLKKDPLTKEIPVVFISALHDLTDKVKGFEAGGVDYIPKPFQPEEVLARVENHLTLRNLREELKSRNNLLRKEIRRRKQAQAALQKANDELEARVARRTAELTSANQELKREIEERRKAEKAVRESEERYRTAIEHSSDGVAIIQGDRILYVNRTFVEMYGYERADDVKGEPITRFIHPDDRERVVDLTIRRQRGEPVSSRYEFKGIRKSGESIWIEVSAVRTIYRGRSVSLAYLRDVTERRKVEEERMLLAAAVEQASESILITDREVNIRYVNPFFQRVSGLHPGEVMGKSLWTLQGRRPDRTFLREVWSALESGEAWSGRLTSQRKDGARIEEDATISPVRNTHGAISHYVAVKRDITHEIRLEKQLRQALKMEAIGALAGGVAHDFNNILTVIIGCTDLALEGLPEESVPRRDLERVLEAGGRAKKLVKQMLTFSRQTEFEKKPLSLAPVFIETLKFLRASLPATIEIRHDIPGDAGFVMADLTQMQQVLMNLCTNAAHAMGEKGGVLIVNLAKEEIPAAAGPSDPPPGPCLRLTVCDTGHGMDQRLMDAIFDPFFTTKNVGEGTGLGLSVVHGIVKSHGGTILVESEPGKGAAFHVLLPRIKHPRATIESEKARPLVGGDERILLVDDEKGVLEIIRRILEMLGYQVKLETNGADALEVFRTRPDSFDLIITDQTMPNVTGLDLAREVMKIKPHMPIILCSGFSETVSEARVKGIGIRAFLFKPVVRSELALAVRKALDEGRGDGRQAEL